ncbi:MAG: NAD(P)-binding domain-containing protein [Planctomycetaceae bacterium]
MHTHVQFSNSTLPACIIGAGSSGIACAKIFHERRIPFDCFEKGSGIGGMWRYNNDSGLSSAYRSLHINTSRDVMQYSDFPMPANYPPFPDHGLILRYFENYVDHFGVRDKITFRTSVESVRPAEAGGWQVTVRDADGEASTKRYGAVCVANGHHWNPRHPKFPGQFSGRTLHSHDYRTPTGFEDKRVLVVGLGNSACDIACEVSRVARATYMSVRRGAHVIPKYLFGWPMDTLLPAFVWRTVPYWIIRPVIQSVLWLARGKHSWYGLPEPRHRFFEEHPTISADLLNCLGHGNIKIKPNIKELAGDKVRFDDGSAEDIDVIIYCTGYSITFPFFDRSIIEPLDNRVDLYKYVVHPDRKHLYFVGLVQPWGAIMPLAELQSKWVADILTGLAGLPGRDEMLADIGRSRAVMARRYTESARHTIQVDFHPYFKEIERERKRGRSRPRSPLSSALESSCSASPSPEAPAITVAS